MYSIIYKNTQRYLKDFQNYITSKDKCDIVNDGNWMIVQRKSKNNKYAIKTLPEMMIGLQETI